MIEKKLLNLFHQGANFNSYEFLGCHRQAEGGFTFRVWAPHAKRVFLCGDFFKRIQPAQNPNDCDSTFQLNSLQSRLYNEDAEHLKGIMPLPDDKRVEGQNDYLCSTDSNSAERQKGFFTSTIDNELGQESNFSVDKNAGLEESNMSPYADKGDRLQKSNVALHNRLEGEPESKLSVSHQEAKRQEESDFFTSHYVEAKQKGDFFTADYLSEELKRNSLPMHRLAEDEEIFELNVPQAREGDSYHFLIETYDNRLLEKADPFAFRSALPQSKWSVVCDMPKVSAYCRKSQGITKPINIYEVNLLSWKRHEDNSYLTFQELKTTLVPYVKKMGYTHVEFMPITEYPFDGSWGYQVTGYFAVTNRLGSPQDFAELVQTFHEADIQVLLDWVPAHFPKDDFGLYEFDGQPLYESALWDLMEQSGWGTRKFDVSRGEVCSFLLSSAFYFAERFGIDGFRVDAVASMLYLDYDKREDEWEPNQLGDNRNFAAIQFFQTFNSVLQEHFPNLITVAEESTTFEGVTRSVRENGLGFSYKWNMGWMNDVLFYCRQDPLYRHYHHNKLTFSMMYAFSEHFVLPLSHDEVVHVKGSIVNKMAGDYLAKLAGERLLLAFMLAHPGKKLNFMGYEFAQFAEWNYNKGVDFELLQNKPHQAMQRFVKELNFFYKAHKPLYEVDDSWQGFEWLVVDDCINNVFAFTRRDLSGESITAICNFSGIEQKDYRIGIEEGTYQVLFCTDAPKFGGTGAFKKRILHTTKIPSQGKEQSIKLNIPKLTCIYITIKK